MDSQFKRQEGESDTEEGEIPASEQPEEPGKEASQIRGISESQEMFLAEIGASNLLDEDKEDSNPEESLPGASAPEHKTLAEGILGQDPADVKEESFLQNNSNEIKNETKNLPQEKEAEVAVSDAPLQPPDNKVAEDVRSKVQGESSNKNIEDEAGENLDDRALSQPQMISASIEESITLEEEKEKENSFSGAEEAGQVMKDDHMLAEDKCVEKKEDNNSENKGEEDNEIEVDIDEEIKHIKEEYKVKQEAEKRTKEEKTEEKNKIEETKADDVDEVDPPLVENKSKEEVEYTQSGEEDNQNEKITSPKIKPMGKRDSIDESLLIPEDYTYDIDEFQSTSRITEESGIPLELLEFYHSFGYDCLKRSNIFILRGPVLLFAIGNMVQLLDLKTNESKYLRTCSGGGVGAITVHPSGNYFAVGEKGNKPHIMIYQYPSLKLYRILRDGTEREYAYLDFNSEGNMLASVGSAPDYMLTVWNWKQETTTLRSKAFSQDVFKATFSPEMPGQLTTCGSGHIRFWKMAWTFTGLKLKGVIGRFGKTALSDIEGYLQLGDGRVMSGSDWGNILVWENGLIEFEIMRKDGRTCHDGAITQFIVDEGEMLTIGKDGCVKVWNAEVIEGADKDEHGFFRMEPMNELKVGNNVQLTSMVKCSQREDPSMEDGVSTWFAQDSVGGLWKLDLSFSHTTKPPQRVFDSTAGEIRSMKSSPNKHLVATTGDMYVRVHDYLGYEMIAAYQSPGLSSLGTCLQWPKQVGGGNGKTIVAGFTDGIVRVLNLNTDNSDGTGANLTLVHAMKPHSGEVTALEFDASGSYMATGGVDNTVFFFAVQNGADGIELRPIGFVSVDGAVTSLTFSPDHFRSTTLLVCLDTSKIVEFQMPNEREIDTSATYLIDNIQRRYFNFKCIKPELRFKEEEEFKELREAELLKERKAKLKEMLDNGAEMTEEEKQAFLDHNPNAESDDDEDDGGGGGGLRYPSTPSPVLLASYLSPHRFFVSMDAFDAGYLYECRFDETCTSSPDSAQVEAINSFPVLESMDVPITSLHFTHELRNLIVGFKNGVVRVYPLSEYDESEEEESGSTTHYQSSIADGQFALSLLKSHWELNMHDNGTGAVRAIAESFDGTRIFTAGGDGNMFGYRLLDRSLVVESMQKASLTALEGGRTEPIDDIDDPSAYSIQDAKLKSEMDRLIAIAEGKKKVERARLEELRLRFLELLRINDELPANVRLRRDEFDLDPSQHVAMRAETERKEARLRLEMQWDKARLELLHDKLRKRYMDIVESDLIVLHAFTTSHTVASYRRASFGERFKALFWKMQHPEDEGGDGDAQVESGDDDDDDQVTVQSDSSAIVNKKGKSMLRGRQAEIIAKAIARAEQAKREKLARQREWNALYEAKPAEDYADPIDVANIEVARNTIGDFKLKSASDYTVPEHLRTSSTSKRNELMRLHDIIHHKQSAFNVELFALRDRKRSIVERCTRYRERIFELHATLAQDQHVPVPAHVCMHPDELDSRVDSDDLDRGKLLAFEEEQRQIEIAQRRGGDAAAQAPPAANPNAKAEEVEDLKGKKRARQMVTKQVLGASQQQELEMALHLESLRKVTIKPAPLSAMQVELDKLNAVRGRYERDQLVSLITQLQGDFDAELRLARHAKSKLDVELKMADLRSVTLLEELVMLSLYDLREEDVRTRIARKVAESSDLTRTMGELERRLTQRLREIERLSERENVVWAKFRALLGDNNPFAKYLYKVFKTKVKRRKPGEEYDDYSDDDDDDDDDDESDEDEDDDDEDGGSEEGGLFDDNVCPPGCDRELFDSVHAIREKKLDVDEALVEERTMVVQLRKDLDISQKKIKTITRDLALIRSEMEKLQIEKQGRMNELDVVVPLHLEQVEIVVDSHIPFDLTDALVFQNSSLHRLHERIKELYVERKEQRDLFKQSRQQQLKLTKNRKVMDARIIEMSDNVELLMNTKFGRIVDLDKLDGVSINRPVEEWKEKIRLQGLKNDAEIARQMRHVAKLKERLTELTRDNTKRLQRLNVLLHDKSAMETNLQKRQAGVDMDKDTGEEAIQEQRRLVHLVQLQSQEIQALKEEIGMLSRKGGHILPPAQPPLAQEQEAG